MQVNVHSIQFKADGKLITFIESKLRKLEQFHDHVIHADVFLKLDKKHASVNKITRIKIGVPGKELFAKHQSDSFEEATGHAVEALRRQIKKVKGKRAEAY